MDCFCNDGIWRTDRRSQLQNASQLFEVHSKYCFFKAPVASRQKIPAAYAWKTCFSLTVDEGSGALQNASWTWCCGWIAWRCFGVVVPCLWTCLRSAITEHARQAGHSADHKRSTYMRPTGQESFLIRSYRICRGMVADTKLSRRDFHQH